MGFAETVALRNLSGIGGICPGTAIGSMSGRALAPGRVHDRFDAAASRNCQERLSPCAHEDGEGEPQA
jgi:hypothetical protein